MQYLPNTWSKVCPALMFSSHRLLIIVPVSKLGWTHHPNGLQMRPGRLPNGQPQPFYFPDDHPTMPGWFKGMEVIIHKRGLWPKQGLLAQCKDFKYLPESTTCCYRQLLFLQPDFIAQKSLLEELIESHSHLCNFYPKYHCELNFIEQFWGATKICFRAASCARTIKEMERLVIDCLNDVPLEQIQQWVLSTILQSFSLKMLYRYANRSTHFITAYQEGLSGSQATWVNKRYHGHQSLPPEMVAAIKNSID